MPSKKKNRKRRQQQQTRNVRKERPPEKILRSSPAGKDAPSVSRAASPHPSTSRAGDSAIIHAPSTAAAEYLRKQQEKHNRAVKEIKDIKSFGDIDVTEFGCFHQLVDRKMMDILMSNDDLSKIAEDKFEEIGDSRNQLRLINILKDEFINFKSKIPIECKTEDRMQVPSNEISVTGVSGGKAGDSNIAGVNYEGGDNLTFLIPGQTNSHRQIPEIPPHQTENNFLHEQAFHGF